MTPLKLPDELICFDIETTGLYAITEQIVELGAVRFRPDGTVTGEFQQLVDPGRPIPRETTDIHGITDSMVKGQPGIEDVLPGFIEFLGDNSRVMMAHNARFDVEFLSVAMTKHKVKCPEHSVIDTHPLTRDRMELPNYRLETIGQSLQLIEKENHRALDDSVLLKDVMLHLMQQEPVIDTHERLLQCAPLFNFRWLNTEVSSVPNRLSPLVRAMHLDRPVAIKYRGGSDPGSERRITPRRLLELRGTVYVTALCHGSGFEKAFRLDRIRSCHISDPPAEST